MLNHYKRILKDTDQRVARSLKTQIRTKGGHRGGFLDSVGLVQPKYAIYQVTTAIAAYCNFDSCYYRNVDVYEMIRLGLKYIALNQHEDGLFDLINCNFHSAPDTAFCVKRMLPPLKYLNARQRDDMEESIYINLKEIVRCGMNGLKRGGFHTPNHRWVIASNLMECGRFFDDDDCFKQAQLYLNEGIDCNQDGEYAEKSSGNYNRINNDAMITLGDITGIDEYYSDAIRNLNMMLTYLEPDGSIFTANSTRQDQGALIYPKDYYLQYLSMGYRKNIPEFLDVANYIFQLIEEKGISSPDILIHFMNHPKLKSVEHDGVFRPGSYQNYYRDSGIVRACRNDNTYTLLLGKSDFFHYSQKTMHLQVKLGGSFCEHRTFIPESMEKMKDGYRLTQTMRGWYYLPFKEKPDTNDWWKMDHTKREKLHGPNLQILCDILECEHGIDLHIKVSGVEQAPFRLEIEVSGADLLWNDQFALPAENGKSMVLKQGMAIFSNSSESLQIGPGFGEHLYINGLFGSEPRSEQAFTLYFTDYTKLDHVIHLETGHKVV